MKFKIAVLSSLLLFAGSHDAPAATVDIPNEKIVDAIYLIEGGNKAQYLYGIRSVKYKDKDDAKRICLNTVRNNKKRFLKQTKYKDYLIFLASRFCPVGCNNDRGTNKFWLRNLRNKLDS